MKKWSGVVGVVVALGLISGVALAQQAKPKQEAPAQDANARKLADIEKRRAEARRVFEERVKAAKTEEEQQKLFEGEMPDKAFVAEYQALAKEAKGTEIAAKALSQVMLIGASGEDMDAAKEAAKVMAAEHIESPEAALLVFAAMELLGEEEGPRVVEALRARNKSKPVAAALLYVEAQKVSAAKGEDAEELRPLYAKLAGEFAEVKLPWGDETYGGIAGGWLFVKDNLVVGKVAPGFEAVDENGVKWKLEEYRGKVVVIDFWGDW
jgi:hypothetical protein